MNLKTEKLGKTEPKNDNRKTCHTCKLWIFKLPTTHAISKSHEQKFRKKKKKPICFNKKSQYLKLSLYLETAI